MRYGYATLLCLVVSLAACSEPPISLRVDVLTDYLPVSEFQSIEVLLVQDSPGAIAQTFQQPVEATDRFVPATPILTTTVDYRGLYQVEVRLLDADGVQMAERAALVNMRGDSGVTVVLTRNCGEISCPSTPESAATECRDGICVPPECTPETPEACPPDRCSQDSECTPEWECARGRCIAGLCIQDLDPGMCAEDEVCAPETGTCSPRDSPPCTPSPEICDGLDNDCNPMTPDGADEPCPADQICTGGSCAPPTLRSVALGATHSCAVTHDGRVFCWGDNRLGQLGTGDAVSSTEPVLVDALVGMDVIGVVAGEGHTCARTASGRVYCWGDNHLFQLGITGTRSFISTPTFSQRVGAGSYGESAMCAGESFTCAGEDGGLICWGENTMNQLKRATEMDTGLVNLGSGIPGTPLLVCGDHHACELRGFTTCWGDNREGALGNGSIEVTSMSNRLPSELGVTALSAGTSFTCVVAGDASQVYCWGVNGDGQLGRGAITARELDLTTSVSGLSDVRGIASGATHTCAVKEDDRLYCWGSNMSGQLGVQLEPGSSMPVLVRLAAVGRVYAGRSHTCAVTRVTEESPAMLHCWGDNRFGQLGDGSNENRDEPVRIMLPE